MSIRAVIGGDFVSGLGAEYSKLGFSSLKKKIQGLIHENDILCFNLEGPICSSSNDFVEKIGPNTTNKAGIVNQLKLNNNLILNLANNHIFDAGVNGLNETRDFLDRENLKSIGLRFDDNEKYLYEIIESGERKVAFVSFAEEEFNQDGRFGASIANYRDAYLLVTKLKEKVDTIVAQYHGGIEHTDIPSPSQRDFSRYLIDVGCDVVIGHHSHCVGCVERYKGRLIVYSLGNLYFPKKHMTPEWRAGMLIRLDMEDTTKLELAEIKYSEDYALVEVSDWGNAVDWISARNEKLIDDVNFLDRWDGVCEKMKQRYSLLVSVPVVFRGIFRVSTILNIKSYFVGKRNRLLKLNLFRCSSHKDMVVGSLKKEL